MSDQEIQEDQGAIRLELTFSECGLNLINIPKVERFNFTVVRLRYHAFGQLQVIDVLTLWLEQTTLSTCPSVSQAQI